MAKYRLFWYKVTNRTMPTIEIASIQSAGFALNQADFEVAIIVENKLKSHRDLFYDLLKKQNGVIIHIGNPDYRKDKEAGYVAGALVDWGFEPAEIIIPRYSENDLTSSSGANQQFRFKLLAQFKSDIDKLLKTALNHSPIHKICFLTDYQFGSENAKTEICYTITEFWIQHDTEGLVFNTLYEMYSE